MKRRIVSLIAAHIVKFICPMGSLVLVLKPLGKYSSRLEGWIGYLPMMLVAIPCSLMYLFDTALSPRDRTARWKKWLTMAMSVMAAGIDLPMFFRAGVTPDTSVVVAMWSVYVVPQIGAFVSCCLMLDMLYKHRMQLYPSTVIARLMAGSVILGMAHWGWVMIVARQPELGTAPSLMCKALFLLLQLTALSQGIPPERPVGPELDFRNMWYSMLMMSAVYCAFPLISLGAFEAVRHIAR